MWADGMHGRHIPWGQGGLRDMVSVARKVKEHLARSPTLVTVMLKDNFQEEVSKLVVGEEKKNHLTLLVSPAGP